MILQALKNYYDRKANELPPEGWIKKGVDYVIILDSKGNFIDLECKKIQDGKKIFQKILLLPSIGNQASKHNNSGTDANLLWDNSSFVFGIGNKGKEKLRSFIQGIEEKFKNIEENSITAIITYLKSGQKNSHFFDSVLKHTEYGNDILTGQPVVTFRIIEDNPKLIFEKQSVYEVISENCVSEGSKQYATCLVTGKVNQEIESCHPVIKGVKNAQTSGASIISFNKDSFCSYGKIQSQNAPVSRQVVQQYVKSLSFLLGKDSKQKVQVGDASTVFWSEKKSDFENDFLIFLGDPYKDDPDYLTEKVKALYQAVNTGIFPAEDKENNFFVLGLAPNAARIAVRFWHTGTIAEFSHRMGQHFHDLDLIHNSKYQAEHPSINRLLKATVVSGKFEDVPPNIAGDWMRCILSGLPYPDSLYNAALRRIRTCTERKIIYLCTAILKACLNRKMRFQIKNNKQQEMTMSLDRQNDNIGYRLGRLFAMLEKIQEEANPDINTTIKHRYYASASGTPASVMSILMRLKNHHLRKLEKNRVTYFERSIGEIVFDITEFPTHLSLENQGRFSVGYYHQRQSFFTKSVNSN